MTDFKFTAENEAKAQEILARYPEDRKKSGMLPLLDLAQRQNNNYLSAEAIQYVANYLDQPEIKAFEVASFYTMFNTRPVGKNLVQFCATTPCWLRGSDAVEEACLKHLKIGMNETTKDGQFTTIRVECLGACVNAPVVQINDDFYEDLTPESMKEILKTIQKGQKAKTGSQIDRKFCEPITAKA